MKTVTYVELNIDYCSLTYGVAPCTASLSSSPPTGTQKCFNCRHTCQDIANFTDVGATLYFTYNTNYFPIDGGTFPVLKDINFTPATVSLGEDLGGRASVEVILNDIPDSDTAVGFDKYASERTYNPYETGTLFGKLKARHPFLQGRTLSIRRGKLGTAYSDLIRRSYIVENTDGPAYDGTFKIVAKDILKLADGDRAQAPLLSSGSLLADITAIATSATLQPSGVGNSEYPASGYINIGGEVVSFTRSSDVLTITRAQFNTTGATHSAGDRCQLCLQFNGDAPENIIWHLMTEYAGIDAAFIPYDSWAAETAAFLGTVYTTLLTEPVSVNALLTELIDIASLAIWWDDHDLLIRLQVLRNLTTSKTFSDTDDFLEGTFKTTEQPDKRLTQVWTYFNRRNPCLNLDQIDNYKSVAKNIDSAAELDYGTQAIRVRYTRWIPSGGLAVAQASNTVLLARYRDPPRKFTFEMMRTYGDEQDPSLGQGFYLSARNLQAITGERETPGVQITRLGPEPDRFVIEVEEMREIPAGGSIPAGDRTIVFDANEFNINLRNAHDSLYSAPTSGDNVVCLIQAGVIIGSTSSSLPSFDVGSWPAGVNVTVKVFGRIEGRGGNGGFNGAGGVGSTALYTRFAITLDVSLGSGEIWGGGGGGGAAFTGNFFGGGGGGGAGYSPGTQGTNNDGRFSAPQPGTTEVGGVGGIFGLSHGGTGGNPGSAGAAGTGVGGGAGGAAGAAIDGVSFVSLTGTGSILGSQIN